MSTEYTKMMCQHPWQHYYKNGHIQQTSLSGQHSFPQCISPRRTIIWHMAHLFSHAFNNRTGLWSEFPDTDHLRVIKSCLIWTSMWMLFEVVTIDLHYMTDRQERFDLKMYVTTHWSSRPIRAQCSFQKEGLHRDRN